MGLDMYAYKAKKCSKKDIDRLQLSLLGILDDGKDLPAYFNAEAIEDKDNRSKFADLMPYMKKVTLQSIFIDDAKIREEYGIPEDARFFCSTRVEDGGFIAKAHYSWVHGDDWESRDIDIKYEDLLKNFSVLKGVNYYVVNRKEVGYWRKEYELEQELRDQYDGIVENCGYYSCNDEMFDAMRGTPCSYGKRFRARVNKDIFYHEWF